MTAEPNGIELAFVAGLTDGHIESLARVAAKATEASGPWSEVGWINYVTVIRDWARDRVDPPWTGGPAPLRAAPTPGRDSVAGTKQNSTKAGG